MVSGIFCRMRSFSKNHPACAVHNPPRVRYLRFWKDAKGAKVFSLRSGFSEGLLKQRGEVSMFFNATLIPVGPSNYRCFLVSS